MARKWIIILLIGLVTVLAACSGESTAEKIHMHLEETVVLEEDYKNQQSEITTLEKQEQDIYAEIIELDMDEFDQITALANEALAVIDEREEKVNLEQESITSASEEFHSIEDLLTDLEDEAANEKANEMYNTMVERYSTYDELYAAYMESLQLERELYEMLQLEDLEQETLNEHIEKVNESYESIFTLNDQFNELTVSYNQFKKEFYEAAEMNVTYNQNEESE
ncbi:YkyA family protein [Oceanobacillus sp. CAU 1775]